MGNATAIPKENNVQLGMVEFLGVRLTVATEGGKRLVAVRPISDSIGLSWTGQLERIKRDDVLSTCIRVIRTQLVGDIQAREVVFLPIEMLNGWLFGIDARRCKPFVRQALVRYKFECYAALAAYWNEGAAVRQHDRDTMTVLDELIGMSELNVIKGLIRDKAKVVPVEHRLSCQQTLHSRLHTRFNVPRTELIPVEQFEAACNFVAAYALEGEWLGKEPKHQPNLSYPIATLVERRESMLTVRNNTQAWLDVTLHDLRDIRGRETPCEKLLGELSKAGYDIEGCWWELRTYRNKVRELASFAIGLNRAIEDPHRYAVSPNS